MQTSEAYDELRFKRVVQVSWPDGDGPEHIEHGRKGRITSVRLRYEAHSGNRLSSDNQVVGVDVNWEPGYTSVTWAWLRKDGTLGVPREAWGDHPVVRALLKEHQPTTVLHLSETAL